MLSAAVDVGTERKQRQQQAQRDHRIDTVLRCGLGCVLVAAIVFIGVVVVLFGAGVSHVNSAVDRLSGASTQVKIDAVLDHVMNAAKNTEAATLNALRMSKDASEVVHDVHPKVLEALNTSSEIMTELKTLAFNPKLTISAG